MFLKKNNNKNDNILLIKNLFNLLNEERYNFFSFNNILFKKETLK